MKTILDSQTFEINPSGDGYIVMLDDKTVSVQVVRADAERGQMDLLIEGGRVIAYFSSDMMKRGVRVEGHPGVLTKPSGAKRGARHDYAGGLTAPMPGQVRSVAVGAGDAVKKGQTLLTIEAMKMEIRIQALKDGKIKAVYVSQGETVEREQILIEVEE